ncbi:MAG: MscL family protein [Acidimicrobiales bacterium]
MLQEFKAFVQKFNVIPTAIGLVLALAILPVVDAVVAAIMSLIGALLGSNEPNFDRISIDIRDGSVPIGPIFTTTITFVLIAYVVFLLMKAMNKAGMVTDAGPTAETKLLEEIRDELRKR